MMKRWMGLVACLVIGQVQAASFDCSKAGTKVEKLICADESLSERDEQMAEAYRTSLKQAAAPEALKKRQLQWLKDLRRYCKTAKCVEGAYWARTRALEDGEGARVYDAPDLKAKKEADKATKVKALLTQYPMRLHVGPRTEKHREFCNRFYEALRAASPEINYIEPVFRTDDPTHPALGEYLDCDLYGGPRGLKTFQLYSRGSRGFRLYQLDIDGNPKNGLEEYIYGQEPIDVGEENGSAGYERVDLNECWMIDGVSALPEKPIEASFQQESGVNALIRYQGKYLVFNLREQSKAFKGLYIWPYDPAKNGFDLACIFEQPH